MLKMKILSQSFCICKINQNLENDELLEIFIRNFEQENTFFSITKTPEEISIVCNENSIASNSLVDKKWSALQIIGPLDFSQIGILARISSVLAENNIPIFVQSTYNTDYIFIKEENLQKTIKVLNYEKDIEII